jgi:hypothetical protein
VRNTPKITHYSLGLLRTSHGLILSKTNPNRTANKKGMLEEIILSEKL